MVLGCCANGALILCNERCSLWGCKAWLHMRQIYLSGAWRDAHMHGVSQGGAALFSSIRSGAAADAHSACHFSFSSAAKSPQQFGVTFTARCWQRRMAHTGPEPQQPQQ